MSSLFSRLKAVTSSPRRLAVVLVAFAFAGNFPAAYGAPSCQLDQAQALFGQNPANNSTVLELLAQCEAAGVEDYRIALLRGVIAREQGHLNESAAFLETAHRQAPSLPGPALELAVTEEWRGHPQAAAALYAEVLKQDPNSRPALLGMARTDRAENNLAAARQIYQQLLLANPQDVEARNGLAWVALADKQFGAAGSGFSGVLQTQPENSEALTGLSQVGQGWRYQLDLVGGMTHTTVGTAAMGGADLQMALNGFSTIEIGSVYNSNELPVSQVASLTQLPTADVRLGYHYSVPQGVNVSLVYDYRDHAGLPTEHWLTTSAGDYFNSRLQWFVGARAAFGAPQWNNLLVQGGLIGSLNPRWQIGVTGYFDTADYGYITSYAPANRNNYAFATDLYRQGPGNAFFNAGIGYSPDLSNLELHARMVIPVTQNNAFLISVEHASINHEYQVNIGWRFLWQ